MMSSSQQRLRCQPRRAGPKEGPVPFANDPFRGPPLSVTDNLVEPLSDPKFLSTALIDYLLQRAMPACLPGSFLIGSANALSLFETMNKKKVDSSDRNDAKTARSLLRNYQIYSFNRFEFLAANCSHNHFFVVHVTFDFRYVWRLFRRMASHFHRDH